MEDIICIVMLPFLLLVWHRNKLIVSIAWYVIALLSLITSVNLYIGKQIILGTVNVLVAIWVIIWGTKNYKDYQKKQKTMIVQDIKPIVKGIAQLQYIMSGGIAVYHITSTDDKKYQLEIDLSDKHDVGETAAFKPTEKALLLMRWIRKANENNTLIEIR